MIEIFSVENFHVLFFCFLADELIKGGGGNETTDTFMNFGALLIKPYVWPWRLVTILMVLRLLQGNEKIQL